MAIFKCPKCSKQKIVSKFRTYFKGKNKQNIDLNTNKEICCDDCKIAMEFIPEEGNFGTAYSAFSGLSPVEKQKLLRKRSEADAKKAKVSSARF